MCTDKFGLGTIILLHATNVSLKNTLEKVNQPRQRKSFGNLRTFGLGLSTVQIHPSNNDTTCFMFGDQMSAGQRTNS